MKKELLNKNEKQYLSLVIKPFRDRVRYIRKNDINNYMENICVVFLNEFDTYDDIQFPKFDIGAMYKGMEVDENYTLDELGI